MAPVRKFLDWIALCKAFRAGKIFRAPPFSYTQKFRYGMELTWQKALIPAPTETTRKTVEAKKRLISVRTRPRSVSKLREFVPGFPPRLTGFERMSGKVIVSDSSSLLVYCSL
jgi:hypothetical protein